MDKLEAALADCQIFSETSGRSHQLILEFTTLEAMQNARDVIIKASTPEVRRFSESTSGLDPMLDRPYGQERADVECKMPTAPRCDWPTCDCGRIP